MGKVCVSSGEGLLQECWKGYRIAKECAFGHAVQEERSCSRDSEMGGILHLHHLTISWPILSALRAD